MTSDSGTGPRGDDLISRVKRGMRPPAGLPELDELADQSDERRKGIVERLEEAASMAFFALMFGTVIIGVFWRYVLDAPLLWTVNLATIAFIWVVMIGSGLPNRDEEHIQFDLVYERVSLRVQRWFRILGNLLIIVPFVVAIPATVDYVRFVGDSKVTGLDLTFDWAYAGIVVFLVATVLHRGRALLADLRGRDDGREQR